METLLDAISVLARQVSPEKAKSIASRIRQSTPDTANTSLYGVVGTPVASAAVGDLVVAWRATNIPSAELASMLMAMSYVVGKTALEQNVELVWTGPTTPVVAPRRTEQVLLQVIDAATQAIFITSFVAYDVSGIVKALNFAIKRGVQVLMLLELSREQGGNVSIDGIGSMKQLVPQARLFVWREKSHAFVDGSVHAKIVVADDSLCFITSANLTGYAMEKNMEAGVLIKGGDVPQRLHAHFRSLIDMREISEV
jgi:phosphatidylserine/phosphatidylglycerophosphate/cardiolipin synthase-like enzyme